MLIHLSLSTRTWKSIFSFTQSIYLPLLLPSPLPLHLSLCQPDAGKYISPEWSIEGPSKNSTESIVPEKSWYFLTLFLFISFRCVESGQSFYRPVTTNDKYFNVVEKLQKNYARMQTRIFKLEHQTGTIQEYRGTLIILTLLNNT
jgi:hypothetical protein